MAIKRQTTRTMAIKADFKSDTAARTVHIRPIDVTYLRDMKTFIKKISHVCVSNGIRVRFFSHQILMNIITTFILHMHHFSPLLRLSEAIQSG